MDIDNLAAKTGILPQGTRNEQIARHLGQAAGGTVQQLLGFTVALHGGALELVSGGSGTGAAAVEVAGGMTLATAGAWNVSQAWQALLSTGSGGTGPVEIKISKSKHPESAAHIEEAQKAGKPTQLTIDRGGAAAR